MAKDKRPFTGTAFQGFLILNAETPPDLWTSAVFGSEHDAQRYMDERQKSYAWDLTKHRIVPCTAMVRASNYP